MREIKFRVFSYEGNEMLTWDQLRESPDLVEFIKHPEQCLYYSEVMQYTGLKDRNGREIYEGDIVSMFGGTQFSVVEWDEEFGLYRIYMQLSGASDVVEELLGNHLNVVEVIGNIYENPELIER